MTATKSEMHTPCHREWGKWTTYLRAVARMRGEPPQASVIWPNRRVP